MTFIIAEAGVNHGGSISTALELVDAAHQAGADAVKFQHFNSKRLWGDARIEHLELSDAEMANLEWYCAELGLEFMATPFGVEEVAALHPIVKRWKIASGCLKKWPLLAAVRATGLPVIVSTGMADIEMIESALLALGYGQPAECPQPYTVLHCTSAYPCPISDVNLAAMDVLRHRYGQRCRIGYSDHTPGIVIALAAVARGATVIEKHLTLDRQSEGPDHKASIEPKEFRIMVDAIRTVEQAIGEAVKTPQPSEKAVREAWYGKG